MLWDSLKSRSGAYLQPPGEPQRRVLGDWIVMYSAPTRLFFLLLLQYTGNIDAALKKINISLGSTDLLKDEQKRRLQELGSKDGLNLNFSSALKQVR